jgi:hypothetical protein
MKKTALITTICFVFICTAQALTLPVHDMATMASLADVIVLCRESPYKEVSIPRPGNWRLTRNKTTASVLRVFKGNVRTNDAITVYVETHYMRVPSSLMASDAKITGVTKVLMFLRYSKIVNGYVPISSGLKLIRKNDVLRFVQPGNPGPLCLTKQTPELITIPNNSHYREEELLHDLAVAVEKSKKLTKQNGSD